MRDVNTSLIQYFRPFYYVAETGSIRRAAAILNLTPSAVSQQIQRLEDEIGMPLFDRRQGHTLRLLPAGRALLSKIPSMEMFLAQLRSELQSLRESEKPVRIGILTLLHRRMFRSLADYTQVRPEASFTLHTGEGVALCRELVAGELDVALVFHEQLPPAVEGTPLFSAPLMLVVHRDLVDGMDEAQARERLRSLPLIYVSDGRRIPSLDAYASAGLNTRKRLTVDSPVWAVEAVRLKLGVAIFNALALPDEAGELKTYALGPAVLPRRIVLARMPGANLPPDHQDFMRFLLSTWTDPSAS